MFAYLTLNENLERPAKLTAVCPRRRWLRGAVAGILVAGILYSLICLADRALGSPVIGANAGGPTNGGETITIDIPPEVCKANIESRGEGCCVFRSISYCAWYQNVPVFFDLPEWLKQHNIPGGGSPEGGRERNGKYRDGVPEILAKVAKDRGLPLAGYVQTTAKDLQFLRAAIATGRPCGVTYSGQDRVWYKGKIDHMVCLVHISDKWAVILDNNPHEGRPAPDGTLPSESKGRYLWMSIAEFQKRWDGWAIVLTAAPPPPVPTS